MDPLERRNMILEGIHYASGKAVRIGIRNGIIFSITDIDDMYWPGNGTRERLPLIAPGLVDLQLNGYHGTDFNSGQLSVEEVEKASARLLEHGVTRYFPTLITGPAERISRNLQVLAEAGRDGTLSSRMIGGIHLEGPFISKEDGPRGAHPADHCLDPDPALVERWQEEAQGRIRILTLAPELPGSPELIRACREMGMVVGIGHTAANSKDIKRAADAGATLSTHLGNGSHNVLPRHPNYIWDQLAEERLYATMIADGFHLPDAVLKVFIRTKKEKALLVSDGMPYTGMKPGLYDSPAAGKIRLTASGKLHLKDAPGTLAGSATPLLEGVRKVAGMEGFSFAWEMASVQPARLLNSSSKVGMQVGEPADLVLLEQDRVKLQIRTVYKHGVSYR